MATSDVDFYKDQVIRLNAVLADYQQKYPLDIINPESVTPDQKEWLTDKSLISPLLAEYDATLKILREQNEQYQRNQLDLRSQVQSLVTENKRLTRELKDAIHSQLLSVGASGDDSEAALTSEDLTIHTDDQLMQNLQQQLNMAVQEKETAQEMLMAAQQEVDRLEHHLQSSQFNPRLKALEDQAKNTKLQYASAVTELSHEVKSLQEQLRQSRNETKAANIQVVDLRNTLIEMKSQLKKTEKERSVAHGGQKESNTMAEQLQQANDELEARLEFAEQDLSRLNSEKKVLEDKIIEIQKKNVEFEHREYEAALQVRESVQKVEVAMMEKDQAMVREKQSSDQVQRLQDSISTLLDEAGARTRQEVDNIKRQCNQNIQRLMDEIHMIEMESSERKAQLERAIREKRMVESELEKIYKEGLAQTGKDSLEYQELNRRACDAERLRDESLVKLDTMQGQMNRSEIGWKKEKERMTIEANHQRERLESLMRDLEAAGEERVKTQQEIDLLKKQMQTTDQERSETRRSATKQVALLERDLRLKTQEYEVKLQTLEDSHRHAMTEIRQMLTSQQRMSAKWKEQCQSMTVRLESKVTDLKNQVTQEKQRNEELTQLLKTSRDKTMDMEKMLSEYNRNIKHMTDRVRNAEHRANDNAVHVSKQMSRARNLMHSTRSSQGGLDGSSLHDCSKSNGALLY